MRPQNDKHLGSRVESDLPDEVDIDDVAFRESFLRGVAELANESGDWRIHLPYEALMKYRTVEAIRDQYSDHVTTCAYCEELMDTLFPREGS